MKEDFMRTQPNIREMIQRLEKNKNPPEELENKKEETQVQRRARMWEEKLGEERKTGEKDGARTGRRKNVHSGTLQLTDPTQHTKKDDEKSVGRKPKHLENVFNGIPNAKIGINEKIRGGLRKPNPPRNSWMGSEAKPD